MDKRESATSTFEPIPAEVAEWRCCESCFSRISADAQCAYCANISQLEQENYSLSQRLAQAFEARRLALEEMSKLNTDIADLSQRLREQAQSFKQMNVNFRETERERTIWRQHATRQEHLLQEIRAIIKSLNDRDKLDAEHCEILLDVIDHPQPQDHQMVFPKHAFQTTTGSVDLAGATIKIVHHALLEMSHLVEDQKIFQLCGSQDHGDFVDWMIGRSSRSDDD